MVVVVVVAEVVLMAVVEAVGEEERPRIKWSLLHRRNRKDITITPSIITPRDQEEEEEEEEEEVEEEQGVKGGNEEPLPNPTFSGTQFKWTRHVSR